MQSLTNQALCLISPEVIWLDLLPGVWIGFATAALAALVFQSFQSLSHRSCHALLLASRSLVGMVPPALAQLDAGDD